MAFELNMPLFLHEREAFLDFITILKEHAVQKAVVHCFTGTYAELKAYLEMGFNIGITGCIGKPAEEVAKATTETAAEFFRI